MALVILLDFGCCGDGRLDGVLGGEMLIMLTDSWTGHTSLVCRCTSPFPFDRD
jgi:hypothetical protein